MKKIDIQRTRLRIGAFIVVACTGAISFMSSRDLAELAHFGWLSWLFPVCLDAVAAVALDIWMKRTGAQHIAGWLGMTAIMLSTASNAADHYLSTGLVLAAVLGVVPPVMLAWLLLALHKHAAPLVLADAVPQTPVPAQDHGTTVVPLIPEYQYQRPAVVPEDQSVAPTGLAPITLPRGPIDYPTVAPPETEMEKTLVMAPIGRKVSEPGETRTKVVPASTKTHLVSMPVGRGTEANADLAKELAAEGAVPARRQIMTRFGVGTGRATTIARLAEELMSA